MNSDQLSTKNTEYKINPEVFKYFRESFTANLAFIEDDGVLIKTERFFDLCIADALSCKIFIPEIKEWLIKRKMKIQNAKTYKQEKDLLSKFIEDYKVFFERPSFMLSGSIQTMVENILENNPTS